MVKHRIKYVILCKVKGKIYYYFRKRNLPIVRLPRTPEDPEFHRALKNLLNKHITVKTPSDEGSFSYLCEQYYQSPEFEKLAPRTMKDYQIYIEMMREKFGDLQVDGISRSFVFAFRDSMRNTPRKANLVISILRRLLNYAVNREFITTNPANKPEQITIKPRYQVWSMECEAAFLKANPELKLAYLLAAYTAQRQGDILHMTWSQYNGQTIKVRQEKTSAYIEVPCHRDLKIALDNQQKTSPLILTTKTGHSWKTHYFTHVWKRAMIKAGLKNLQFRDLRRTAIVRLAEAGATVPEIASISGHTIDRCQRILEVYLPRNSKMAKSAVEKLEKYK